MSVETASRSVFGVVSVILGFLAFAAVVGRFFAGAALGGLAITFQFLTVLFLALLFVLLSSAVIDKLDFSF